MTSLKGHGSLQNVPPHVLQDDHADYEAVADGPVDDRAPLHQGQLRSVVGNSPIMGGDPTIGGNPTTGWYSTQHLVGILTIFTIDAI